MGAHLSTALLQMLERLGWRDGEGLGVDNSGTATPLAAWELNQSSRQGIGTESSRPPAASSEQQAQKGRPPPGRRKLPSSVEVKESFDTKASTRQSVRLFHAVQCSADAAACLQVKRINQTVKAEQDERDGRELQTWLYRQFRDCSSEAAHNPVQHRHHRLQASNPLL